MKKSLKPALFSAFICPGSGQLLLKAYPLGFLFLTIAVSCSYFIALNIKMKVDYLLAKVLNGEISLTTEAITKALEALPVSVEQEHASIAIYVLIAVWLTSVINAYCQTPLSTTPEQDTQNYKL